MKVALDIGHNCPPYDLGATGWNGNDESKLVMGVAAFLVPELTKKHKVLVVTPQKANSVRESLLLRTREANRFKADVFISLHCNAFTGTARGTEVLYVSDAGKKLGQPILDSLVKLGWINRGMKLRRDLFVLNNTDMPACLVEICFCDNRLDVEIFDPAKVAFAISDALG